MRRVLAILTSSAILISLGCGSRSYQKRLDNTIKQIQYRKKLDDNLMPFVAKGKLEQNLIYIRPPKQLEKMPDFTLMVLEPGKFDVAETFVEKDVQSLHVVAWVKKIKDPKKKSVDTPRGTFSTEVFAMLGNVFNVDIEPTKAKPVTKKKNSFKHLTFEANEKTVQVYLYGDKAKPPEVALIFEYGKKENLTDKINLCLESFATNELARLLFTGSEEEEGAEGPTAPGGAAAF
jgi:hypothetical protein